MIRRTGVARKIDQLGRVVLPAEVRRHFDISAGDLIEIAVDDGRDRARPRSRTGACSAAGPRSSSEFAGKLVCGECVEPPQPLEEPRRVAAS